MPGTKWINVIVCAIALWAALPTLKNVVLYLGYHHGNETLDRVSGEPGTLVGTWEGTFDTIQCGMDERHDLSFEVRPDSTGSLRYRFLVDRYGAEVATVYGWKALLPRDQSRAWTSEFAFRLEGEYALIAPDSASVIRRDTLVALLRRDEGAVRFAYVDSVGAEPVEWGLAFGASKPEPWDLIAFWNLTGKERWE